MRIAWNKTAGNGVSRGEIVSKKARRETRGRDEEKSKFESRGMRVG